jgi:hypothetical protein
VFAVNLRPRKRRLPRDVTAGSGEARNQTSRYRVGADAHNRGARHSLRGSLSGSSRKCEDDIDVEAGEFHRKCRELFSIARCGSVFNADGFPLVVSEFLQTSPEGIAAGQINSLGISGQITEQWNPSRSSLIPGRPVEGPTPESATQVRWIFSEKHQPS